MTNKLPNQLFRLLPIRIYSTVIVCGQNFPLTQALVMSHVGGPINLKNSGEDLKILYSN